MDTISEALNGRASLNALAEITARESREHFDRLLGPLLKYVTHTRATNIEVNEDGAIFFETFGEQKKLMPETMDAPARQALISNMARRNDKTVDRLHSRLRCDMPYYDARVTAWAPPISFWPLMIRIHSPQILSFDTYLDQRVITKRQYDVFHDAITAPSKVRPNIAIVGEMDSGKSTFNGAFVEEMARFAPDDRLIIIQDVREIKARSKNKLWLFAEVDQAHHESNGSVNRYVYGFEDLLNDVLRTNGNRFIFGEMMKPAAAVALMLAMNSGARGLVTTMHAQSCEDALYKVEDLLGMASKITPSRRMIARFINMLVFIEKGENGQRLVSEIVRVKGVDHDNEFILEHVV